MDRSGTWHGSFTGQARLVPAGGARLKPAGVLPSAIEPIFTEEVGVKALVPGVAPLARRMKAVMLV